MEWNKEQVQFLLDNKPLIEQGRWAELWDESGIANLDLNERKHLFLGIAVIAKDLKIRLEIKNGPNGGLFIYFSPYDRIKIYKYDLDDFEDLTDIEIETTVKSDLIRLTGVSEDLVEKIIGKLTVIRR